MLSFERFRQNYRAVLAAVSINGLNMASHDTCICQKNDDNYNSFTVNPLNMA